MLSETKTSRLFIFYCLHVVRRYMESLLSRRLLKFFFLKSNNVLDAVLSTDLGEHRCSKFLIRQLVSLNKAKIICSVTDRKLFVCCLRFLWCEDLACDWLQYNKHSRHILGVQSNIITTVIYAYCVGVVKDREAPLV